MRAKKFFGTLLILLLIAGCGGIRPDLNRVTDFKVLRTHQGILMIIRGTRHPTYTVFRLENPPRIVVDIAYTDVGKLSRSYRIKDAIIKGVKIYQYGNNAANVARFELYLKTMKEYLPEVKDDTLYLFFPAGKLQENASVDNPPLKIAQEEGENILEEDEGLFEETIGETTSPTENTASATEARPATEETAKAPPEVTSEAAAEEKEVEKAPAPETEEAVTEEKEVTTVTEAQEVAEKTPPPVSAPVKATGTAEVSPPAPEKVEKKAPAQPAPAPVVTEKTEEVPEELKEQKELEEKALTPTTTEEMEETAPTPPPPPPSAPEKVEKKPKVADKILDINVERLENSTLIRIVGNGPIGNYNVFKLSNPARLVVDLWNVGNLFPTNQLYLDTPTIKELRLGQHPEKLRVVIEFKTPDVPDYNVEKKDDSLELTVSEIPPAVAKTPEEERKELEARALGKIPSAPEEITPVTPPPPPPPQKKPVVTPPAEVIPPAGPKPAGPLPGVRKKVEKKPAEKPIIPATIHKIAQPQVPQVMTPPPEEEISRVKFKAPRKIYRGRRISLDFKDADIHNVLRLLAEVSNLNIIASSDVKGKVTVRMVNVPWDQALDVILQTLGLGYVRIGNVIRVAPRKELEQEEKERLEALKSKRELEPLYVKIIPVNYGKASEIAKQVKPLLSKRGSVSVDERTNVIIVKDIMRNIKEVETLVHNLDTQTPQVLIEARIVEATTNFSQELGIQWGGKIAFGAAYGTPTGLNFPASGVMAGYNPTAGAGAGGGGGGAAGTTNVGTLNSGYVVDLPAAIAAGAATSLGLVLGSINNSSVLDMRLSAIEDAGEGRIISSPRITTMDNREAIIEQGYSIPYETVSQQGTQTQFIDATLKLKVTPHITADRNIILDLDITKNAPETSITSRFGIPSISKKEAKTQILLHDGETAVIGGIFQIEKSKSRVGVPFLSKIPVIGWLFRRSHTEDKRTELLIFLTPRIIQKNVEANNK